MREARKLGFVDGALAPWRGLRFVLATPAAWPFALAPAAVFVALAAALGAGGFTLVHDVTAAWAHASSSLLVAGAWALRVVLWVATAALAIVVALALSQPLSGPALDKLVELQERALGLGVRAHEKDSFAASTLRSVRVSLVSIALTIFAFVALTLVELAFAPAAVITTPLKFVASSLVLAWDVVDYPLSLRKKGLRDRVAWFRAHLSVTLGFALSLGLVFLVPCAGLLLLPAGVAGAARVVVETEDEARALPSRTRAISSLRP